MANKDKKPEAPAYYEARETFHAGELTVIRGQTVEAGHPMLKGKSALFRPFVPTYTKPGSKPAESAASDFEDPNQGDAGSAGATDDGSGDAGGQADAGATDGALGADDLGDAGPADDSSPAT